MMTDNRIMSLMSLWDHNGIAECSPFRKSNFRLKICICREYQNFKEVYIVSILKVKVKEIITY